MAADGLQPATHLQRIDCICDSVCVCACVAGTLCVG